MRTYRHLHPGPSDNQQLKPVTSHPSPLMPLYVEHLLFSLLWSLLCACQAGWLCWRWLRKWRTFEPMLRFCSTPSATWRALLPTTISPGIHVYISTVFHVFRFSLVVFDLTYLVFRFDCFSSIDWIGLLRFMWIRPISHNKHYFWFDCFLS